ncbi:hypothetical protein ACFLV0_07630, partial [Chloroflexota bacterium]
MRISHVLAILITVISFSLWSCAPVESPTVTLPTPTPTQQEPTPTTTPPPKPEPAPSPIPPSATTPSPTPTSTQELKVYYLDVGQGDSILIDYGQTEILIDGGDRSPGV